jgi:hypothetical protein
MTGTEIIALALQHYGDSGTTYVTSAQALQYLNEAILEVYEDLPPHRLKNRLITSSALTNADGAIPVDPVWDKVIQVYLDDELALQVNYDILVAEGHGASGFFTSPLPFYHIDEETLWIRPVGSEAKVVYLSPPTPIVSGDLGNAVTALDSVWHPVIAILMTSYMYAQEEDLAQAQHYKTLYQQKLSSFSSLEQAS